MRSSSGACHDARNKLAELPDRIVSLARRPWVKPVIEQGGWYKLQRQPQHGSEIAPSMVAPRKPPRPPWKPNEPCPCGSGVESRLCCLWPDRRLRVKLPRLTPPEPATGYAHPRCYLNSTNDCSTKISGEHFISKNALEAMKGEIEFGGLPWKKPGETVTYGISSLASNILCQRHNSAWSPLDTAAGRTFRILQEICEDISPANKSLSRKETWPSLRFVLRPRSLD